MEFINSCFDWGLHYLQFMWCIINVSFNYFIIYSIIRILRFFYNLRRFSLFITYAVFVYLFISI